MHDLGQLLTVHLIRRTPLPWRIKYWTVWALSARFRLGSHVVISDARGRVLTLHSVYSNEWQLPGGTVDYGEGFVEAMRREAREELGADLGALSFATLHWEGSGRQLVAVFTAAPPPGEIRLSVEHDAWCYQSVDALSPYYRTLAEAARGGNAAGLVLGGPNAGRRHGPPDESALCQRGAPAYPDYRETP
jgi:8-oxo-dGTP pyrophosphatase MutT (NUDIX family)